LKYFLYELKVSSRIILLVLLDVFPNKQIKKKN
jgi:hypothetical protein